MLAKATKRKPTKKKGGTTKISTKGFGAKAAPAGGALLDEAKYADLYAWLSTSSLTNLKKVAVADFGGLRGVMALQDIGAGEEIVAIPATLAVDVGADGADVVNAAQRMLGVLAAETEPAYEPEEDELEDGVEVPPASPRAAYWATLPPPDSPDLCTPDFFSEKELMMLQWPPLVTETRKRSARIRNALGAMAPSGDVPTSHLSAAGGGMRLLRWAVWAVQSRVLTVVDRYEPAGRKLLIPFIDMFNHRAGTKHYLTGRTDGMLRVVAGAPVRAGEQIFIKYGTESTSNDEFVAHCTRTHPPRGELPCWSGRRLSPPPWRCVWWAVPWRYVWWGWVEGGLPAVACRLTHTHTQHARALSAALRSAFSRARAVRSLALRCLLARRRLPRSIRHRRHRRPWPCAPAPSCAACARLFNHRGGRGAARLTTAAPVH
jgi:hypothetical protein